MICAFLFNSAEILKVNNAQCANKNKNNQDQASNITLVR